MCDPSGSPPASKAYEDMSGVVFWVSWLRRALRGGPVVPNSHYYTVKISVAAAMGLLVCAQFLTGF